MTKQQKKQQLQLQTILEMVQETLERQINQDQRTNHGPDAGMLERVHMDITVARHSLDEYYKNYGKIF